VDLLIDVIRPVRCCDLVAAMVLMGSRNDKVAGEQFADLSKSEYLSGQLKVVCVQA